VGQYQTSSPKSGGPQLSWQVSYRSGRPLIYVRGELDHSTAGILRGAINDELREGAPVLLLDFTDLTYMDSGGLSLMFETVQRFKEPGWLGVVGANPGVCRLMEITGLVDHRSFRLLPDLSAANTALSTPEDT